MVRSFFSWRYLARPCLVLFCRLFSHRNSIVPIDSLVVDCLRSSSENPNSGKTRRSHSMRSRGSKSFRFLQILSAANKQHTGARAPDRQQAAEPLQHWPLVFRFAAFSAALAYSDIAAVCCDSSIVRWQEILSPSC